MDEINNDNINNDNINNENINNDNINDDIINIEMTENDNDVEPNIAERVEAYIDDPDIIIARFSTNNNIIEAECERYNIQAIARYSNEHEMKLLILFRYIITLLPSIFLVCNLFIFEDLYINFLEEDEKNMYYLYLVFVILTLSISWNMRCYISKFINILYLLMTLFINTWIVIYNINEVISIIISGVFLIITSYLLFYDCKNENIINRFACILLMPLYIWIFFTILISLEKIKIIQIF